MSTFRKNLAVGLTVAVGLALLGLMILMFGDVPIRMLGGPKMRVFFNSDSAEGVSSGTPILFRGVEVGRVTAVEWTSDHTGVKIEGSLDKSRPLPANMEGVIKTALVGGGASLNLELLDPKPAGVLKPDATLHAHAGASFSLPPEFTDLAREMTALSRKLNTTVADFNKSQVVMKVANAVDTMNTTVAKAGDMIDDLRKTVGDEKMRKDISQTLDNFRAVSENARVIAKNLENFSTKLDKVSTDFDKVAIDASVTITKAGGKVDEIAKQVGDRLEQVAGILQNLQSVSAKIDKGDGTAGKLVNDARLYEALLDSSRELTLTIKDLRRLVEQWEQEGVSVKLGGKK